MSIFVCIPTARDIDARTIEAALRLCGSSPTGASFRTFIAHPTDRCRNVCVEAFLQSDHSHMLFIDSDVVPPADALLQMLAANHPLVCGIYPLQLSDNLLCASVAMKLPDGSYGFLQDLPDEPFDIDISGLGCCLIAREVFEHVEAPWFKFVPRENGRQTGEDTYFFEKCAAAGITARALPHVLCSHHRMMDMLGLFQQFRSLKRAVREHEAALV